MCKNITIPIDPIVKCIHNLLFHHTNIERKVESVKEDKTSGSATIKLLNEKRLQRSIYTRGVMQVFAAAGGIFTFSIGLLCTRLHHIDPTISYYSCMFLCMFIGYVIGMFIGAICGRVNALILDNSIQV